MLWRRPKPHTAGTLMAIYVAARAGAPIQAMASAEAVSGAGLCGDRYAANAGFWRATDACQVTLICCDDLRRASRGQAADIGARLARGHHRRNLVVEGLTAKQLEGRQLRIGGAVFVCDKPRPPCGYLDSIEGRGLCRALGRHAGMCLRVIESGELAVGDAVEIITAPEQGK